MAKCSHCAAMSKKKSAAKRKAADKKEDKIYKKGRQEEKVEFVMDEFKHVPTNVLRMELLNY
jgi:hypothetical protein